MKKSKIVSILVLVLVIVFTSCSDPGVTSKRLDGNEMNLPDELKGLKVYSVSVGGGDYVKVAILNDQINSLNYPHQKTTLILNKEANSIIEVKGILMENDSIIIFRK